MGVRTLGLGCGAVVAELVLPHGKLGHISPRIGVYCNPLWLVRINHTDVRDLGGSPRRLGFVQTTSPPN